MTEKTPDAFAARLEDATAGLRPAFALGAHTQTLTLAQISSSR